MNEQETKVTGATERKFKVGDVVRLRSGDTLMTVGQVAEASGSAFCVWFDGDYNLHREWLAPDLLTTDADDKLVIPADVARELLTPVFPAALRFLGLIAVLAALTVCWIYR